MRKLVLAARVVAVAVGASAGAVLGTRIDRRDHRRRRRTRSKVPDAPGRGAEQQAGPARATTRRADSCQGHRTSRAARHTWPAGRDQRGTAKCPRRSQRRINGYFGADSDTAFPILNSVGDHTLRKLDHRGAST